MRICMIQKALYGLLGLKILAKTNTPKKSSLSRDSLDTTYQLES